MLNAAKCTGKSEPPLCSPGKYVYEYPRGALTVDCVVFGRDREGLKILLIERGLPPFEGTWALPGGFVQLNETLEAAAHRELEEETGLRGLELRQLHTFGAVERDPRERVISVAHLGFVDPSVQAVEGATDARRAAWFLLDEIPPLAFDHQKILSKGRLELNKTQLHEFTDLGKLMAAPRRRPTWG